MDAELRKDFIVNRWVLISPRRGKRPHDYNSNSPSLKQQASEHPGPCAFCYHHEHETGPELLAFHLHGCAPNQPCWRVRVVQNKFPAVSSDLAFIMEDTEPQVVLEDGPTHCSLPGFGSHEVVIETPEHDQVFTSLSVDQVTNILRAYQARHETLRLDPRYKYCQIFKNNGNAAGASMVHSHSQIIALPIVPKAAEDEFIGAKAFHKKSGGKCVFCEAIRFDTSPRGVRVIDQLPYFISMAPYAARFPYETWILPRKHNSNFGTISNDEIKGLAEILKLTLCKMDKGFNFPPFNFMLQTGPLQDTNLPYYHWYIRIVPHLTSIAGFELGSGCHINPVSPENAAEFLRGITLDDEEDSEVPQSNGTTTSADTNGSTEPESQPRLVNMAELGKDVEDSEVPQSNGTTTSADTNGSTDPESQPRLINMAELGKDVEDKNGRPLRLINMADLGEKGPEPPQRLIYMADLEDRDHKLPDRLIKLADLREIDQKLPDRLLHMANLGENDHKPSDQLVQMADEWKNDRKTPERLINMADLGKQDQNPPERLIKMADLGESDHESPVRIIKLADLQAIGDKLPDRLIYMADL